MPKKERNNNSKKRKFSEEEEEDIEDLNLNTYKKKKFNGNRKNIKYNDNEDSVDTLNNEVENESNSISKIDKTKGKNMVDNNNENNNVNINVDNNKEDNTNGDNNKEDNSNEDNNKEDNSNEDNTNENSKYNNKNSKQNTQNSRPLRKSKRLLEKKIDIVNIELSESQTENTKKLNKSPQKKINTLNKNDNNIINKDKNNKINNNYDNNNNNNSSNNKNNSRNSTTVKRKRMNADQDLITHQNIEEVEQSLGNKNPMEIIKKVIGNSMEEVELVVGAQLPVLVQPEINRMKYQLGEIIAIQTAENLSTSIGDQKVTNINQNEIDNEDKDNKKRKKNNNKKEVMKKETENKNENVIENTNNNETIKNSEKLYYIHFLNQDKRLDNWRREEDLWTKKKYPEISNDSSETTTRTIPYLYIPNDKGKLTRNMKRKYGIINESLQSLSEIDPKLAALEKEREEITKVKNIEKVQFGNYLLNAWYFSPYPNEYKNNKKLYICDHCMKYMKYESTLIRHKKECTMDHPPGLLVYEKDNLRVYEVDGKKEKLYCQNFCLLSKLFLDHKTVYYDIEPFIFYVLTEKKNENGKDIDYIMGYFSKEKRSFDDYNLACILVLPPYQRKGYGHFLIEFSYELSKRENKIGSPEKPLSDLGLVSYRTYWQSVLLRIIKDNPKMNFTLRELSLLTSIRHEDIVSTLGSMNMLKYWKGEHSLCVTPKMVEEFLSEHQNIKMEPMVDASLIHDTFISEPIQKKKIIDLTKQ